MSRVIEWLDTLGHRLGWCPRLICDLHDWRITGEWPR